MRVAEFERPCDPKKSALGHHEKNQVKPSTDRFHMTSWRPYCWTKTIVSALNTK